MVKHITVGLDGSTNAAAAEELALALAGRLGAVVQAVHVIDAAFLDGAFITDISGAMGFEPFLNLQAQVRSTLEDVGKAIGARFEERREAAGVEGSFQLARANVATGLLQAAKLAELLVVGQRGVNSRFHEDSLGPTSAALLRRSPIPILLVPERGAAVPRHPLVAYDGSPKASRALGLAAALCRSLSLPLAVMVVDEDGERARARLAEATAYLAPYDLSVTTLHEPGDAVEQIILGQLEPGDFDLLCLGAHGHSRMVELVIGSTTDYLAHRAPVPVLCATRP